jgi:ser/thr/tyr protein kinase RAD53
LIGFIYRHLAKKPPANAFCSHYDVVHELGKGSFAVVMKAVQRSTGKFYAVKMIQESRQVRSGGDNNGENNRRKLFTREIGIMENLRHPNITELKEVFYEESGDISEFQPIISMLLLLIHCP